VMADVAVDQELTIGKTTLDANPPDVLPPPPDDPDAGSGRASTLSPFTVPPTILNTDEIVRAMERAYPAALRDAGIGGTVTVLFHIDEEGAVQEVRVEESSGHDALDRAALSVATRYEFSPALNRDRRVAVWVSFPVTFRVRE
ncbi:MAG: energy transducer TonB, partial [Longimicrobiales bacterium]|nr:energy transducer TonB [Longimicrobiales bacterium]